MHILKTSTCSLYYSKRSYTYLLCKQLIRLYSHSNDHDLQYTVHHIMCLIFYCQELLHSCNCIRHHSVKSNEKLKMQKKELYRKTIESNKLKDTKWVIKSRNLKERKYNGHQKTLHRKWSIEQLEHNLDPDMNSCVPEG